MLNSCCSVAHKRLVVVTCVIIICNIITSVLRNEWILFVCSLVLHWRRRNIHLVRQGMGTIRILLLSSLDGVPYCVLLLLLCCGSGCLLLSLNIVRVCVGYCYVHFEDGIMEMTGSSVNVSSVSFLSSSLPSSIILLLPKAFMGDCTALTNACASRSNSSFPKG